MLLLGVTFFHVAGPPNSQNGKLVAPRAFEMIVQAPPRKSG